MNSTKLLCVAAFCGISIFNFVSILEAREPREPDKYLWQLKAQLHNTENAYEREDNDFLLKTGEMACYYKMQGYDMDDFADFILINVASSVAPSNENLEERSIQGEANTHTLDFLRLSF